MNEVTQILDDLARGDTRAADKLLPLVYDELRKLAAARMFKEAPGNTLEPTALVHEAYVRLVGPIDAPKWKTRGHFFAVAATAMRRILIERARHKQRAIHGGGRRHMELSVDITAAPQRDDELLALDAALIKLAELHPLKARLVELRYFAGLTNDQAAKALDISPSTADRHWVYARAWLRREVEGGMSRDHGAAAESGNNF